MNSTWCLDSLNAQQQQVVTTTEGPLLVLAGAGSGKTRSVIHRAVYLMQEKDVKPWHILVVTFTNKAAQELKHRFEEMLRFPVHSLWVGTFHSLCTRILRFEAKHLTFHANFSIYDDDDQKSLLKKIYKQHNYDNQKIPITRVMATIGRYKNKLLLPEDIMQIEDINSSSEFFKAFINIYHLYQQNLLLNQALDFDDILLWTAKLLENNEQVRSKYQNMFRYIMIDEYQDTNYAQFKIIHLIAQAHHNICVVGDDDQAIYSWRGATLRNILEFERDYGKVTTIRLEQNYRSSTAILDLANAVIMNNRFRHVKQLWSALGEGEKPRLVKYDTETSEANQTAQAILSLQSSGTNLRDIAVLYRTNAQSRVFEYAFVQNKIPYTVVGSQYFYQRKEIKDILGYLKVCSNTDDNEGILRIINEPPRGIGQTTVSRIINYSLQNRLSLYQAIQNPDMIPELNLSSRKRVSDFSQLMNNWRIMSQSAPVLEVVKSILEELRWIELYRNGNDPKDVARAENLEEFVASVSEFTEHFIQENDKPPLLVDYLPFVALQTDLDQLSEERDTVRLMTLHNAKGLEFDHVFIVGLEEELLPHRMSQGSPEDIEEERRLFYVGITRTKKILTLSRVEFRRIYDTFYYPQPSRFLGEIDSNLFFSNEQELAHLNTPHYKPKKKTKLSENNKHFKIGQTVFHSEYGKGTILSVDGVGVAARLTISFTSGKLAKIIGEFVKTEEDI